VEEFLYQEQLTRRWAADGARGASLHFLSIDEGGSCAFHRLWSALSFLFAITESLDDEETPLGQGEDGLISNEAEFGHGFLLAGSLLLHLLGQRAVFELLDFSRLILRVHDHDELRRAVNTQRRPYLLANNLSDAVRASARLLSS
jgi:hypothetical protein